MGNAEKSKLDFLAFRKKSLESLKNGTKIESANTFLDNCVPVKRIDAKICK